MKTLLIVFISILIQSSLLAQTAAWKLKSEVDDLKVYTRKTEGSNLEEIKVNFIVHFPLMDVVALVNDVPASTEWVYACKEARVVKLTSATEMISYGRVSVPFPMNDRDYVVKSKLWQDAKTKEVFITTTHVSGHVPAVEDCVRIPKMVIKWRIKPVAAEKVHIEYHLVSDPGGTIPDWVVNLAIDKGPVSSIKNMKKLLQTPKYRNAKLSYIKEAPMKAIAVKKSAGK